jgi:hypothetical protein
MNSTSPSIASLPAKNTYKVTGAAARQASTYSGVEEYKRSIVATALVMADPPLLLAPSMAPKETPGFYHLDH